MLYRPIWFVLTLFFRVYFKRFYVSGRKNLVTGKPVIMPCNHVNAFIDPIMLPSEIWPKVHYIVRGDIFNSPFKRWLLWQMNQIPMYRARDGASNVKKNDESFERCYDILSRNQRIMIFSEGDCVQEKHLRSIKKGTARMAFGTVKKHGWDIDLQILPNTVNYTYPSKFRTEVIIKIGEPISLLDYKEAFEADEAKAMTTLSRDIEEAIKKIYIHIEDRKDLNFFEQAIKIERANKTRDRIPWSTKNNNRFAIEQNVANKINELRANQPEQLDKVKADADDYYKLLKKLNIRDKNFGEYRPNLFFGSLIGLIGFPIFALGYILNIGQHTFANNFVKKNIRLIHFKNSIRLGFSLVLNILITVIISIVAAFQNIWLGVAMPFILFAIAWCAINYYEYMLDVLSQYRFVTVAKKQSKQVKLAAVKRMQILKKLGL